jgi:hypothetical protein
VLRPLESGWRCRVEMWRGDVRLGISGSGPFGCRCLTSLAMAPFPHPAHQTGCEEQKTHLVTPGQIAPTLPIIGLSALLGLVEWYEEHRRKTQQGGLSCTNLVPPLSPPAPQQGKPPAQSSAALGDHSRHATRTNSERTDPRRRPTTGEASRRQGGDA